MSLISIIIPAKNAETTLAATLDSVAGQSGVIVEAIVVDDASTDRTREIAVGHAVAPRVIASPRPGASAARNAGLAVATGEAIVFLDADDQLKPGALERRARALAESGPNTIVVTDHVELVDGRERPSRTRPDFGGDPREALLNSNRFAVHAAMVSHELLDRVPGHFDEGLTTYEDWALWLRLALLGAEFRVIDVADCEYRIRLEGMTTDRRRARGDGIRVIQLARAWVAQVPAADRGWLEAVRRRTLRYLLWLEARAAVKRGNLIAGAFYAFRALATSPAVTTAQAWRKAGRLARAAAHRLSPRARGSR
jgi:glycosyltransferase involved in cell wall biosynthesis